MSTGGGCRPVGGTHRLVQRRPDTSGGYIPAPAREDGPAQPVVLPDLSGELVSIMRKRVGDFHIETLPDWSGSTFSVWGGDPRDVIGAVAVSVFLWLRRHGGGTAGVLPWGTTPARNLAVGPLSVKRDMRRLKPAIRQRVNLGGNDLPAALRATAGRIFRLPAGVEPFIWVPTDGIESVTQATHDAVAALPHGSVHMVLIDPLHGCTESMESDWRSVAFGSVTRIEDLSVRNVATTIAQLCADTLGLQLGTATPTIGI
jgi:hypothetical protein